MNTQVVPERRQPIINPQDMLGLIGLALLVIVGFGAVIYLNWNSWGKPATIICIVLVALPVAWRIGTTLHDRILHHKDRTITHRHTTMQLQLAERAMAMGHSVEMKHTDHLGRSHELRTISPLTIPNAPVTIKEMNMGGQQALPSPQYPVAPPFAAVKPLIRPGNLVLGYNSQGPIVGDVTDLLSMAFVGKPGTGKSTGLLYYLAILLMTQASVYVFDPQGSLYEISGLMPYYGEYDEIYNAIPAIYEEIEERENLWRYNKVVKNPLLILVDELPALARYEEKNKLQVSVLDLAEKIVTQNRKHNCFCLLTGQSLPANVLPTLTRDNLSSRLVFNSSDMHARMAGLDKESREKLLPLLRKAQPGTAILDVSRRPQPDIAALPFTTIDDLRSIIDGNSDDVSVPLPEVFPASEAVSVDYDTETETTETAFPISFEERKHIIELAKEGMPRRQMCKALGKSARYYKMVVQVLDEEGL